MAIVYHGQYRLQGAGTWSVLFTGRSALTYPWDTSALAEGTYEVQVQAEDTSDAAQSAWSTTRTIAVSHGVSLLSTAAAVIVAELEYAVNGGAWTPLTTYPLAETRYAWDLSAFADGDDLAVRVRNRDLSDDAVSAWSETRTLTVSRATPAPVEALAVLPAMRGLTAGERAVYAAQDRQEHVLVEIRDEDGTWHDLAALGGEDFFVSARVTDSPDQPVLSAELALFREVRDSAGVVQSLAPFMVGSALNVRASDSTYSPLIQWGRRLRIRTAVLSRGATPTAGDWVGVFEGTLDDPDWGAGLTVTARDDGKRLQDVTIAEAKQYGSDDGTALADVLRQMLADNGCGDLTLCVVGDPDWFLRPFTQDADVSLMDALQTLVLQIGWDLRFRWTDRTTLQLVLSEPTRADVSTATPIFTLSPSRYLDVGAFATESDGVRNSIRVAYLDRASGEPRTAHAMSPASIAVYGLRPMQLAFDATSNIDTQAEAEALATTVLSDLAEPAFRVQVDYRLLGALGRGDVVSLAPNGRHHDTTQQAAVVALVHELGRSGGSDGESSCTTTLTLRGRALGAYRQWLRREAPPSPSLGPVVVRARAERVSADDTTETWRLYAEVTRGGRPTGQVATLTVTALGDGVTITSGPAVDTAAPQGTLWTFARPTGAPSRFTYRAAVVGALADEDAETLTQQGVAIEGVSRLTWSEFALVEAESDALTSHYRGVLTDADGAATGDATVVLTRTGADDTVTPTTALTGPLPLTIEFDVPRQPFQSGESVVEAYGSAPGVQGDWERISVAEKQRDTVEVGVQAKVTNITGSTATVELRVWTPNGSTPVSLALALTNGGVFPENGTSNITIPFATPGTTPGTAQLITKTVTIPSGPAYATNLAGQGTATGYVPGSVSLNITDTEGAKRARTGFNSDARVVTGLEDLATIGQQYAAQIAASSKVLFLENFDRTLGKPDVLWQEAGSLSHTITTITEAGLVGGTAVRITGQAWRIWRGLIPFNPNSLYRFRVRVRGGSPTGAFYAGFVGIAADKTTKVNVVGANSDSSQHYVAASGVALTPGVWQTFTGWMKGSGTWTGPSSDPTNPAKAHPNVRYLRVMFIVNYPSIAAAITDLDYLAVDEFDADGQVRIYKAIDSTGNLNPGVGQSDGVAVREISKGHWVATGRHGDPITFPTPFADIPTVICTDIGGLRTQPDATKWLPSFNSSAGQYSDMAAEFLTTTGFTIRALLRQRGAPTARSHALTPTTITTVNATTEATLANAPAADGKYRVAFDVDLTADIVAGSGITGDAYMRVLVSLDYWDDTGGSGSGAWTPKANSYYTISEHFDDTNTGTISQSWTDSLSFTQTGVTTGDKVRLKILSIETTGGTVAVGGALASYTTTSGDNTTPMTPQVGDAVQFDILSA